MAAGFRFGSPYSCADEHAVKQRYWQDISVKRSRTVHSKGNGLGRKGPPYPVLVCQDVRNKTYNKGDCQQYTSSEESAQILHHPPKEPV